MNNQINCRAYLPQRSSILHIACDSAPLYAWKTVSENIVTISWWPLFALPVRKFGHWKTLSNLRYLQELGICRIWTDRLFVRYKTHFCRGKPIYPLLIKKDGNDILLVDCMLPGTTGYRTGTPLEKALYLGLHYDPAAISSHRLLRDMMPHIVYFLRCLGNRAPVILIIGGNRVPPPALPAAAECSVRTILYPGRPAFRLVAFTPEPDI